MDKLAGNIAELTPRQQECLYYLARGNSMKEIARYMNISSRTVEKYIEAVKYRLRIDRRSKLVEYYYQHQEFFESFTLSA